MLWRPLKSHCTTHHVWERGRELPKKCLKSYRSHSLARFVHFRSASIIIRESSVYPKWVQNEIDTTKPSTKHERSKKNVWNRDIHLVFRFVVIQIPLLLLFCSRDNFFVIDFFFFCAVSGLGQVPMCFFFPLCLKWRFTWGKILQEHFKVR